jgi:hypothetical protein
MCMAFSASSRDEAPRGIRRLLSMIGAAAVMAWFIARIGAAGLAGGVRELAARRRVARDSA